MRTLMLLFSSEVFDLGMSHTSLATHHHWILYRTELLCSQKAVFPHTCLSLSSYTPP